MKHIGVSDKAALPPCIQTVLLSAYARYDKMTKGQLLVFFMAARDSFIMYRDTHRQPWIAGRN